MVHKTGLEDYYVVRNQKKLRFGYTLVPVRQEQPEEQRSSFWEKMRSEKQNL